MTEQPTARPPKAPGTEDQPCTLRDFLALADHVDLCCSTHYPDAERHIDPSAHTEEAER